MLELIIYIRIFNNYLKIEYKIETRFIQSKIPTKMSKISMHNINMCIRNAFVTIVKNNDDLLDSYLECYKNNTIIKQINRNKHHWFIGNVTNNKLLCNNIFESFMDSFRLKYPNMVITGKLYEYVLEYISEPDETGDDENEMHTYEQMRILMDDCKNDKEILRLYYNEYMVCNTNTFIHDLEQLIECIKQPKQIGEKQCEVIICAGCALM